MQVIDKSAEHHFLTTVQKIKDKPQGWVALYFGFSKAITKDDIIWVMRSKQNGRNFSNEATEFFDSINQSLNGVRHGFSYLFKDFDVLILAPYKNDKQLDFFKSLHVNMANELKEVPTDFSLVEYEVYGLQKLSDQKLLSALRMNAYDEMQDQAKTQSVSVRRKKRDYPLVQLIEDDRFTSSYAAGFLNKDYDLVISRNGEQGIIDYIDNAPDVLFIDIHLPGMNGHDVLNNIRSIDAEAFAVMLSVDTMRDNIVNAAENGANNFLKKPFSKERMVGMVKSSPYIQNLHRRAENRFRTNQ